ncbi:MAG: NADH-quinone oxidoreductase subunit H [Proteobacteria bacterium]|nr:NADH-quinone oxidoreductase subunit H [Pseudomonadota bacterium]MBU1714795.1 NADH-quinone oxidoreductase subunit H [Pseudomonadota bacterium]
MIFSIFFHLLILFGLAPLLAGIIARVKAKIGGRQGQPLLQLYWDLGKLFRKRMVISTTTTWVFRAGPLVGFVVPVMISLLVPFGPVAAPISFSGDLVLFAYLLALARFFTVLAALDTGSSFEGMGAAREATFAILIEPTIFVVFIVLARLAGDFSLNGMFVPVKAGFNTPAGIATTLAIICLFIVMLAENCRIPFDDPNTHLELTMIHEVMVLDHSGPDLALILYGAAMKLMISAILIADLLRPVTADPLLGSLSFLVVLIILAIMVGLVESAMARLRLIRIPQLLVGTTLLSFFALIMLLR